MVLLDRTAPLLRFLPEIASPTSEPSGRTRLAWTAVALLLFLVCSQVPVYGARPSKMSDPFYWMRVVLASNKGTLMELGISPIISANLILELLAGLDVIALDHNNKEQKAKFEGLQKLMALIFTLVQATAYVMSGMYGDVAVIGVVRCAGIVIQLLFATVLCMLLDEVLQKGWGIGSGTSLFIATNICETIVWKCFSLTTITTGRGTEFEGAIIAFFHLLVIRSDKSRALKEAFYRTQLPNMVNLISTAVVFLVVVFVQGFHVRLATQHATGGQYAQPPEDYKVRLFYTSNMPIILQTSVISNFNFVSQLLYRRFGSNVLINFIGKWEEREYSASGQMFPVGGIARYITAPQSLADMLADPLHAIFHITFVLTMCAMFSKVWITINNSSPRDEARKLVSAGLKLRQYRAGEDEIAIALNRYIPTAAALGGLCIGLLSILADFLGAIGSGTGILLAVTMINQFYEQLQAQSRDIGLDWLKKKIQ